MLLMNSSMGMPGKVVTLMVTNPGSGAITVEASGSGYSQDETGGLPLGGSPDFLVSQDWIEDTPSTVVPPTSLAGPPP